MFAFTIELGLFFLCTVWNSPTLESAWKVLITSTLLILTSEGYSVTAGGVFGGQINTSIGAVVNNGFESNSKS